MGEDSYHTTQQYEGQEHQFLDYQEVYIYFIYSFTWDINISWETLQRDLLQDAAGEICKHGTSVKGWKWRRLHDRVLWDLNRDMGPTYQPSLVTKKIVLERSRRIAQNIILLVPIKEYRGLNIGERLEDRRELPVSLEYTVRLFENGGATCTFAVHLPKDLATFENIHSVLHLAHNVDLGCEPDGHQNHLTNAFIKLPEAEIEGMDSSLFPQEEGDSYAVNAQKDFCFLHDLFRRLLNRPLSWKPADVSPSLGPHIATAFRSDEEVIDLDDLNQDFQSPFVFTIAQVERNSFLRFRKASTINAAREIGSILCKVTLDNRHIEEDYLHTSEDYLTSVLPYNRERHGLVNLCLDRRLFFAFSRRGAIALTANLKDIPSYFVIPSLLNLCEILRVRWYMGSVVSAGLDMAIAKVGSSSPEANSAASLDTRETVKEMFKWRTMAGAFLRDPVPFLFDGGSVSEIAEMADRLLWLDHLRVEVTRKFDFLDNLVSDYLNLQRWHEFQYTDKEETLEEEPNVE